MRSCQPSRRYSPGKRKLSVKRKDSKHEKELIELEVQNEASMIQKERELLEQGAQRKRLGTKMARARTSQIEMAAELYEARPPEKDAAIRTEQVAKEVEASQCLRRWKRIFRSASSTIFHRKPGAIPKNPISQNNVMLEAEAFRGIIQLLELQRDKRNLRQRHS